MITLITGVPGSGKTYLAVKTLSEKFYIQKNGKWFLRDPDLTVFTNINDLKLPSKNLSDILKDIPFDRFFTKDYQDIVHQKYPKILYVLDECQQFIPPRYNNNDVVLYFDTHRHYSDQIYLITQDEKKICKQISTLVELEYRAVRSTFSMFGEFKYNIKASGEIYQRSVARKSKAIFDLYRSFDGDGQQVKKSRLFMYIIILTLFSVGSAFYMFHRLSNKFDKSETTVKNLNQPKNTQIRNQPKEEKEDFELLTIENKAMTESRGLIAFQCPVSGEWFFDPYKFPYTIINRGKHFYAVVTAEYQRTHSPDYQSDSTESTVSFLPTFTTSKTIN
jgi:hypothetical protein